MGYLPFLCARLFINSLCYRCRIDVHGLYLWRVYSKLKIAVNSLGLHIVSYKWARR